VSFPFYYFFSELYVVSTKKAVACVPSKHFDFQELHDVPTYISIHPSMHEDFCLAAFFFNSSTLPLSSLFAREISVS
jgi:hypothetical protein